MERPGKRMRGEQSDTSIENDIGYHTEDSNGKHRSDRRHLLNRFRDTLTKEKLDEYDEIWVFAMIPENDQEIMRNLEGLRNK
jgi:hypothetical protein